eukprot:CAMPEP_0170551208 /NCGR_PEP_ID=MMETSP0211-20121228/9235_1 /TAXON_ID=311385 /ORGANISM="Pseudokeronopsis sp., Strain OXSARD2" /LENGTH=34 /DNA_ID= /DNA_START= /DNA_END= /DNA_ORIENTATION=
MNDLTEFFNHDFDNSKFKRNPATSVFVSSSKNGN